MSNLKKYERVDALVQKGKSVADACAALKMQKSNFYYWRAKKSAGVKIVEHEADPLPRARKSHKSQRPKLTTSTRPLLMVSGSPDQLAAYARAMNGA